jgi:hypothetical protein
VGQAKYNPRQHHCGAKEKDRAFSIADCQQRGKDRQEEDNR